ncbi:MAG: FAD-binding oxidoreductase [Natronospirillum sp.]|uniref:L-pipecolate oxidase n=1 Tax=Natronospirillum sp. TaxID=2812955 RepID=UPI0025E4170B|nr:FAD-binding oxidoreductase [Natronospirillum sp.]MCH8553107.1 FAD-binding oxidoreductase [Natronospirillum sp.]
MQAHCIWETDCREPEPSGPQLKASMTTDVCVIGGGITGLSTALHLAEQGASVVVLEAQQIGAGGSGRNVGLVNAGLWIPPDDITDTLGQADGERVNAVLGKAPQRVFELIERHRIQCDATRTGTLHLAHSAKAVGELERRQQQFCQRGAPVTLLRGAECERLLGTNKVPAALLDARAGTINPLGYTRGLARVAEQAGAMLYSHSGAQGLERTPQGWSIPTAEGRVQAQQVVLATNAYTEAAWNVVQKHCFPGYFYQVASEPLEGAAADAILPERQGCWDTRTVLSSIRRDAHGRLILGSLGRGDTKPEAFVRAWANRIQRHYFPQLGRVRWQTTWTGRIAFTPEHTLRVFSPAEGLLAVTGYNGRGNTTGTMVGQGLANWILHGKDDDLPLPIRDSDPVTGIPLRSLAYESGFTLYHAGQCLRVV